MVTTVGGLLGIAVQTPIGAAIDATRAKRLLVVVALALLAGGAVLIYALPEFWPVMVANILISTVGDVFGPAIAALTLGLYARAELARRIGRNSAFYHAGNVAIAAVAGAIGWFFSQRAVFLLVPVFAVLAALAGPLSIPADAIDHERARGAEGGATAEHGAPSGLSILLTCRPLLIYAACTLLFHFANAPLLPLVGQKLALAHQQAATAMMSSCIIAAQLIMLPVALAVGHSADRIGRKPLLLIGFAVLPIRAFLYTASDNAAWLIGVQLLDGIGAGIFRRDHAARHRRSDAGRRAIQCGRLAIATVQGIGASLSGLAAGLTVDRLGYSAAFVGAGVVAAAALLTLVLGMPETARFTNRGEGERDEDAGLDPSRVGSRSRPLGSTSPLVFAKHHWQRRMIEGAGRVDYSDQPLDSRSGGRG